MLSHPTGSSAWWGVVEAVFLPLLAVCWTGSVVGQAASYQRSSGGTPTAAEVVRPRMITEQVHASPPATIALRGLTYGAAANAHTRATTNEADRMMPGPIGRHGPESHVSI